MALLGQFRISI